MDPLTLCTNFTHIFGTIYTVEAKSTVIKLKISSASYDVALDTVILYHEHILKVPIVQRVILQTFSFHINIT